MHGCLLKAEADMMVQRLAEAEDAAGKAQASVSGLAYKAQVQSQPAIDHAGEEGWAGN